MKKETLLLFLLSTLAFVLIFSQTLMASTVDDWGTNITINDGRESAGGSGWYGNGTNRGKEDQEVEPDNETGQFWDLEGFFLNNTTLGMVGGYDFVNGEDIWQGPSTSSGDIFIDTNGSYGTLGGNYGYEYVIDLDFANMSYTVFDISDGASLQNVFYASNAASNPWRYLDGGQEEAIGDIAYETGLSDTDSGFLGGLHNLVQVDLSFLSAEELNKFTVHFTMECGNDNLMGANPVPEPATLALFGIGLLGISLVGRKRQ